MAAVLLRALALARRDRERCPGEAQREHDRDHVPEAFAAHRSSLVRRDVARPSATSVPESCSDAVLRRAACRAVSAGSEAARAARVRRSDGVREARARLGRLGKHRHSFAAKDIYRAPSGAALRSTPCRPPFPRRPRSALARPPRPAAVERRASSSSPRPSRRPDVVLAGGRRGARALAWRGGRDRARPSRGRPGRPGAGVQARLRRLPAEPVPLRGARRADPRRAAADADSRSRPLGRGTARDRPENARRHRRGRAAHALAEGVRPAAPARDRPAARVHEGGAAPRRLGLPRQLAHADARLARVRLRRKLRALDAETEFLENVWGVGYRLLGLPVGVPMH